MGVKGKGKGISCVYLRPSLLSYAHKKRHRAKSVRPYLYAYTYNPKLFCSKLFDLILRCSTSPCSFCGVLKPACSMC